MRSSARATVALLVAAAAQTEPRSSARATVALLAAAAAQTEPRHRPARPHCATRGRQMVAFGAHTDAPFVQNELERLVESARAFDCPPTDVVRRPSGIGSC